MAKAKDIEIPQCSNCMYYKIDSKNLAQGECLKDSPDTVVIPTGVGSVSVKAVWPPVRGKKWCGQHEWKE